MHDVTQVLPFYAACILKSSPTYQFEKIINIVNNFESLFLGFLKEDLFIFLQIIFQDFKFFLLLLFYRVTLS